MKLHVGTSGYSYKEWKGNFYCAQYPIRAGDFVNHQGSLRLPSIMAHDRLTTEEFS